MLVNKSEEARVATILVSPVVLLFCLIFVYPTLAMVVMSFTNAPLIGSGEWVGFDNYIKQLNSPLFYRAVYNTLYFVALTVAPGTILALLIAMGVNRLKGWLQAAVLACFFIPFILPVSVVVGVWNWMGNLQYGILQHLLGMFNDGRPIPIYRNPNYFLPSVAIITIWWTIGFNILLYLAALRNVSPDIYEAAALDNTSRWRVFSKITWPLIWPITSLVITLSVIGQFKIFTQAYLLSVTNQPPMNGQVVLMRLMYDLAFTQNKGGEAATVATLLFVIILIVSFLLFRFLNGRTKSS